MLATALTLLAAAYLFASLLVLAPRKDGYRHLKHTISEIGEWGSPHKRFVAMGLFMPVGLMLLLVALLVRPASPATAALAGCIAAGYIGAALWPCDSGSPMTGSARQALHNLAGAIEYIGGGFTLTVLSETLGQPLRIVGFVVLATAVALSVLPAHAGRGAVQRVAEACLFGGLAFAVWAARAVA